MDLVLGSKVPAFGSFLSVSLYSFPARKGGDSSFSWVSNLIACRNRETSYGTPKICSFYLGGEGKVQKKQDSSEVGLAPASPYRELPGRGIGHSTAGRSLAVPKFGATFQITASQ